MIVCDIRPGPERCPSQGDQGDWRRLSARSGEGGEVLRNPAPQGGKGFEKSSAQRGKGFEKVVRTGSLGFENRQAEAAAAHRRPPALPDDFLREASARLGIMSLVAAGLWVVGTILGRLAMRSMQADESMGLGLTMFQRSPKMSVIFFFLLWSLPNPPIRGQDQFTVAQASVNVRVALDAHVDERSTTERTVDRETDTLSDTLTGGRGRNPQDESTANSQVSRRENIARKRADGRHSFS